MATNNSSPTKILQGKIYTLVDGLWHELKVTGGRTAAIGEVAPDDVQNILNGGKMPPPSSTPQPAAAPPIEKTVSKVSKPTKEPKPIKIRPPRPQRDHRPPKKHPRDSLTGFHPDYPNEKPIWPSFVQRMAMSRGTGVAGAIRGSISDRAKYRTDKIKNAFLPENITRSLFGKTAGVLTAKAIGAGAERTQRVAGLSPYERWLWSKRYNKHTQDAVASQHGDKTIRTGISGKTIHGGEALTADMVSGESVLLLQQIETNTNTMMKIMSETFSETYGKHKYEALKATMFKTQKNHIDEKGHAIKENVPEKRNSIYDIMMLGLMGTVGVVLFKYKDKLVNIIEWFMNNTGGPGDPKKQEWYTHQKEQSDQFKKDNPPVDIDSVTYEDRNSRQANRKNIFNSLGEVIKDMGRDISGMAEAINKPIQDAHEKLMNGFNWLYDKFKNLIADMLDWIGNIKNPITGNSIFPGAKDRAENMRKDVATAQQQRKDTSATNLRNKDREMVDDYMTQPTPSLFGKNPWEKGYGEGISEKLLLHNPSNAKRKASPVMNSALAREMIDYLSIYGHMTKEQAAGIVANLQRESGLDPTMHHPDPSSKNPNGYADGLAQWQDEGRKDIFRKMFGKEIYEASIKEQLDYLLWELQNPFKNVGEKLRKTDSPSEASNVMAEFEKYGGWNEKSSWDNPNGRNDRAATAEDLMSGYNKNLDNMSPSTPSPTPSLSGNAIEGVTGAHKDATGGPSGGAVTQINNVVNNNNSGGGNQGGGAGLSAAPIRDPNNSHVRAKDANWADI